MGPFYLTQSEKGTILLVEVLMKTLKIPQDLHQKLKIQAAKEGVSLMELIIKIITKYLSSLAVLLLFVSCASPKYYETKVEKWSYSQIEHQQKIKVGMDKAEVTARFGAPDRVQEVTLVFAKRIEIEYLYKIWCSYPSCRVYVDPETGLVTSYENFRYEYTESLK